jgi:5-methylphenazine-1-carboxylate 1-monooxygenase
LQQNRDPLAALLAYEQARTEAAARVVRANRENPPDIINLRVEQLTGDRPFENLDDFISQDELRRLSEQYKAVAGFDLARLSASEPAEKAG